VVRRFIYGEQVSGQAYFGGGHYSGDYTGGITNGKGNGLPGTGGGSYGSSQLADSGIVAIRSGPSSNLPSLTFDAYNKLTLTDTDSDATSNIDFF